MLLFIVEKSMTDQCGFLDSESLSFKYQGALFQEDGGQYVKYGLNISTAEAYFFSFIWILLSLKPAGSAEYDWKWDEVTD